MSVRRVSAVVAALLSLLWLSGCPAPPPDEAGEVTVTGSAPADRIEAYEVMAGVALAEVRDLWGEGAVPGRVRVVLPATAAEFRELTGSDLVADVPASTVGSMEEAHVVVHPDSWGRLTPQGRQAVLTHEVTHLLQQGHGPVPAWLGEGIAEYTAHRSSDVPPATIAGSALDGVRDGQLPTAWPDPTGSTTAWGGYALSWLACLYLADTWGEEALLEVYDQIGMGASVPDAVESVLGVSEQEALTGWGTWLTELVSGTAPRSAPRSP